MPKVDQLKYRKGIARLSTFPDSDHAGEDAKRKSTTRGVIYADGVVFATLVRKQDVIAVGSGEGDFYAVSTVAMDGKMIKELLIRSVLTGCSQQIRLRQKPCHFERELAKFGIWTREHCGSRR